MISPVLFASAYVLDLLIGDPRWLPHPVRLIGWLITAGEKGVRRVCRGKAGEFIGGTLLTIVVVGTSVFAVTLAIRFVRAYNHTSANIVLVYLSSTTLATHGLIAEVYGVGRLLRGSDLVAARVQVGRIVGRDTDRLNEAEIVRASIETASESASDGIVAPMFYLALGGVPAAMAYKAINTLDSMIGHDDDRYRNFGKFAARLDDVANFVPARLTALLITAAALAVGRDARLAYRMWRRDGSKHRSPNAGQVEAAMAGALNVRLGGLNFYDGEPHFSPLLGDPGTPLTVECLNAALIVVALVSLFAFLLTTCWLTYWNDGLF